MDDFGKYGIAVNNDCFNIFKSIDNNSVPLVIADIPFNNISHKNGEREKYGKGAIRHFDKGLADTSIIDIDLFIDEVVRIVSGSGYIFCEYKQLSQIYAKLESMNNKGISARVCVWSKRAPSPMNGKNIWLNGAIMCVFFKKRGATYNYNCKSSVWSFNHAHGKRHPAQFPVDLLEYLILASSNEGDLVVDPLAGSFATGEACINTNRKFFLIEKESLYYNPSAEYLKDCINNKK